MFGHLMMIYQTYRKPAEPGQGVIEYAGALVIAVLIVSTGLVIIPPNFAALISTITNSIKSFLIASLA